MQRTLQWLALLVTIAMALVAIPLIFWSGENRPGQPGSEQAPWEIIRLDDGSSRVFTLHLKTSSLAEARERFGREDGLGLVVGADGRPSLEAYYDSMRAGFVTGKMVLGLDPGEEALTMMASRARVSERLSAASKRLVLASEDIPRALAAKITTIAFIPTADLDEEILLQRFGVPEERVAGEEGRQHWLYPDKGLEVQLDPEGKEVLQYVLPREFERIREPLAKGR